MISTNIGGEVIKNTNDLYKSQFKVCFILAVVFSIITEYVKVYLINLGIDNALSHYFATGRLPDKLQNAAILTCLICISVVTTIIVHGILISLFNKKLSSSKALSRIGKIYEILNFIKIKKFCNAIIVKIILLEITQFLSFISYFLGIIGVWLVTSFSFIILPMVLFENIGVIKAYKKTINLMCKYSICSLQVGFMTIIMLSTKNIINVILYKYHISGSLNTGMMHVITIFIEALIIPYTIILTASLYFIVTEKEKIKQ
jgi:hypothetical protein